VKSLASSGFWKSFDSLPREIQESARRAFERFQADPFHPGLQFKQVDSARSLWSVRIGLSYRAIGLRNGDEILWQWIGGHDDYERRI
jgi:hypothetical protein